MGGSNKLTYYDASLCKYCLAQVVSFYSNFTIVRFRSETAAWSSANCLHIFANSSHLLRASGFIPFRLRSSARLHGEAIASNLLLISPRAGGFIPSRLRSSARLHGHRTYF